jgi:hypothetical protein
MKKLVIVGQLPIIGAFVGSVMGWFEQARQKPHYALLFAVLYEVGLFGLTFGKKVWDELEKGAVLVTADWIRGVIRRFAPGFRRRYRQRVIREQGHVNFIGLGMLNTYALPLEQVFVDLRIAASNPQKFSVNPVASEHLAASRQIWDFLRNERGAALGNVALAVVGPPGCGKTTLLKHLAVTMAANRQRTYGLRAYTPIFIHLRKQAKNIAGDKPLSLGALAHEHFSDESAYAGLRPPVGWFEKHLAAGKCLILLDGLDEVADLDERQAVSLWVGAQIRNYPRCQFVVTSRPQGYRDAPVEPAHVLEVQPFSARQVRKFVVNWYLANEYVGAGGRIASARRRELRELGDALLGQLRALPSADDLTSNPLLLTMIVMVSYYSGALPKTRAELYERIFQVLLVEWQKAKGIQGKVGIEDKLGALRELAAYLMRRRLRETSLAEALEVLAAPLERAGLTGDAAVKSFIYDLQSNSGILLEHRVGHWGFAHLTFQEYLTSVHWLRGQDGELNLRELVGDSWWYETLRFYAGQGDATALVRACLDVDDVSSLMLAADCLAEAAGLDDEVRREIESRVLAALDSPDPTRRRIAAKVRLSRRLRHSFQRIGNQCEIDMDYLTCAEYQLFLDDARAGGKFHQPDHWPDLNFPEGAGREPVRGVRAEDARAFCEWLTGRRGGQFFYRLPQHEEVQANPASVNGMAAWCEDAAGFRLSDEFDRTVRDYFEKNGGPRLPQLPFSEVFALHSGTRGLFLRDDIDWGLLLARALAFYIERDEDLDLALAVGHSEELSPHRHLLFALDREPGHVTPGPKTMAAALPRVVRRVRDVAFARDYSRPLERVRRYERIFAPLVDALRQPNLKDARMHAQALQREPSPFLSRCGVMLADLLDVAQAADFLDEKVAQCDLSAFLLGCAYRGMQEANVLTPFGTSRRRASWLRRLLWRNAWAAPSRNAWAAPSSWATRGRASWFRRLLWRNAARKFFLSVYDYIKPRRAGFWARRGSPVRLAPSRRAGPSGPAAASVNRIGLESATLEMYWWLAVTNARRRGALQAWEAVRLVRVNGPAGGVVNSPS